MGRRTKRQETLKSMRAIEELENYGFITFLLNDAEELHFLARKILFCHQYITASKNSKVNV